MAAAPIPIILCGRTSAIGTALRDVLYPSFVVVKTLHDAASAISEIPQLLTNEQSITSTVQQRQMPAAVLLGGAFTHKDYEQIRRAAEASAHKRSHGITWLMKDQAVKAKALPNDEQGKAAYGREIGQRALARLQQLAKDEQLFDEKERLVYY